MNIHEYQAKEILKQYGVKVPEGRVAFTVDEAVEAAKALGTPVVVVKAQIHAGGRGKAGGVKVAKSWPRQGFRPPNDGRCIQSNGDRIAAGKKVLVKWTCCDSPGHGNNRRVFS